MVAATAFAIASVAPATAFDRVETSHSTDPGLLPGAKTPITAEVRVFGPWRAHIAGESGSDMPPVEFTWQSGVPIPFASPHGPMPWMKKLSPCSRNME
jgi:hypothetical protein